MYLPFTQASLLKAGIYCKEGEFLAMGVVLEEYARFINGTVSKNAKLLSQCDVLDKGVSIGVTMLLYGMNDYEKNLLFKPVKKILKKIHIVKEV